MISYQKKKTAVRFARGRFSQLWDLMKLPQDLQSVVQIGVVGGVGVQPQKLRHGQDVILHKNEKAHDEISFQCIQFVLSSTDTSYHFLA